MSAQDHLNPRQFRIEQDSDSDLHALDTYHPDFGAGKVPVGSLYWDRQSGKITNVTVQPEARRQGVASRMYAQAQTMDPPARHAPESERTGLGKKWVKGVGGDSTGFH
jgi:GNAT superfamily N-acetyltransferase